VDLKLSFGTEAPLVKDKPRRVQDVIILGAGPAGLSAAIYAARANHSPLLVTGQDIGGQVATTNLVENYPGFTDGITGPELARVMQEQAEKFGAQVEYDTVASVNLSERPFHLVGERGEYRSRTLILATGASPTKLNVPGERELIGRGVSYCATCDGYFFQAKEIVVVGGGDSALEEGLFLTKFAARVTVIHRRNTLRAGAILQRRARENPKMNFIWNSTVTEILGSSKVEAVRVRDAISGEERVVPTHGIFIYIGHQPNTQLFKNQLEMDEHGYVVTDKHMRTSVAGVFAAGEVTDPRFRQVITSAGMGAAAAMEAEKYLAEHAEELSLVSQLA
jgi:thioredoxin reductase (NADPH)